MICMSRRSARSAALSSAVTFLPLNHTSPEVGSMSRRMQRPVVDLPQPDSPTSPRVSPASSSKLTPLTACTRSTSREKTPPLMTKFFTRFFTRNSGSVIASLSLQHLLISLTSILVSSPGLTGRSSNHRPGILDCPVEPGNDTGKVNLIENALQHARDLVAGRDLAQRRRRLKADCAGERTARG